MTKFREALQNSNFDIALLETKKLSTEEIEQELVAATIDDNNIFPYTFVIMMLQKEETAKWHYLASSMLFSGYSSLPNASNSAIMHIKRALELDPMNIFYWQHLIACTRDRDSNGTNEELERYKNELRKLDPKNEYLSFDKY
jgi:hypothetical protein